MRSPSIISVIVGIGLALPASAQPVDPNTRQQIERVVARYAENFNKQDAAGITSLYARDGILVSPAAKVVKNGAQEIEQSYQSVFNSGFTNNQSTLDQASRLGSNAIIAIGETHLSGQGQNGPIKADLHWTMVAAREGGSWKIRLLTAVPNPPPTASGSAAPSAPTR